MMISFVVPARNERAYIAHTISALREAMADEANYEIIVVDNASTDDTRKIIADFAITKMVPLDFQVSISKARNIGVGCSTGAVLVFIDADILITKVWATALAEFLRKVAARPLLISGYRCALSKQPSWVELTWFDAIKPAANPSYINSGNLITTRALFDAIGGFTAELTTGEDVDFCRRAVAAGATVAPDKSFFAHHEGYPRTIGAFFRREQWHGIGDVESIGGFVTSKVALFAYGNALLLIVSMMLLLSGSWHASAALVLCFFAANTVVLLRRFNIVSVQSYCSIFLLHVIYLAARCTSVFVQRTTRTR